MLAVVLVTGEEGAGPDPRTDPGGRPGGAGPRGAPQVVETEGELAVGITEQNPNLVWPAGTEGDPRTERWRLAMDGIRPAFVRIVVEWRRVQPDPLQPANFELPQGGCLRATGPCVGWTGVRDQLRAAAARQRTTGMQVLVVLSGTPDWAARPARGCEPAGTEPRARPPRTDALPAYAKLVADTLALARREGVELRYWSAWNEPNHPYTLSPQRPRCSGRSPTASVSPYVELTDALRGALLAAPGEQEYVLGELAAAFTRRPRFTSVTEFVRRLPDPMVCGARAVSQHAYIGGRDPVETLARALATHDCTRTPEIWITETGVGAPRRDGRRRETGLVAERAACAAMHERLVDWYEDPRVTAAFQYTLREDDRFQTGLVDTRLARAFPVLGAWQAWGGTRDAAGPPPSEGVACPG